MLLNDIANSYGVDITNPQNKSSIDKRFPRPFKMTEQEKFGSVNLNIGKAGTLKGVSRKKVINYNPRLSIEQLAKKNNVSAATIRLYIKKNHIDRERDSQLLIYLSIHKNIKNYPNITIKDLAKKAKCSVATAKKYMEMKTFDIPVREGHVSLVHDDINN